MYDKDAIRVLLIEDEGGWVAQCVEYDIGTQGATVEEASKRMGAVLKIEGQESLFRTGRLFGDVPAAPPEFLELWDSRRAPNGRHESVQTEGARIQVSFAEAA